MSSVALLQSLVSCVTPAVAGMTNVYGTHCLTDNWYEDRHQPSGSLSATGGFPKNSVSRPYETDLAYIGERYDVLSRLSRLGYRESYATPHDGFNEKTKTSLEDFCHPKSRVEFSKRSVSAPRLITTENAPVRPPETRELPGTRSGFGSAISRHPDDHDQRHHSTTYGSHFGEGNRRPGVRSNPALFEPSGLSTEREEHRPQGLRVGKLCGEAYNDTDDPGKNSPTQRSWLYSPDASHRNIHLGGTRRSVQGLADNHCSLPLGDGAMSKVRQKLKDRDGKLFLTSTTITTGKGSKPGINIFQDH